MIKIETPIDSVHLSHLENSVYYHFKVKISRDIEIMTIIEGYPDNKIQAEKYIKMFLDSEPKYLTMECTLIDLFQISSFVLHVEKKCWASIMHIESDIFCIREENEHLCNLIKEMNCYVLDYKIINDNSIPNDREELLNKTENACEEMNINFYELTRVDDLVLKVFYKFFISSIPPKLNKKAQQTVKFDLKTDMSPMNSFSNTDSPSTSQTPNYFTDYNDPLVTSSTTDIMPHVVNTIVQTPIIDPTLFQNRNNIDAQFRKPIVPSAVESAATLRPRNKVDTQIREANSPSADITQITIPPLPEGVDPENLRHVVIDASNVAYEHGMHQSFSAKGILIVVQYFLNRGHRDITCLVPRFRQGQAYDILKELHDKEFLKYTPSRLVNNVRQTAYDDRMLLELVSKTDGIIVSNDQYRDIANKDPHYKHIIDTRLINYVFVKDIFMIPEDPHGQNGPSLSTLLMKEPPTQMKPGTSVQIPDSPVQNRKSRSRKKKMKPPDVLPQEVFSEDKEQKKESLRTALFNQMIEFLGEDYYQPVIDILNSYPHVHDSEKLINMIMDRSND